MRRWSISNERSMTSATVVDPKSASIYFCLYMNRYFFPWMSFLPRFSQGSPLVLAYLLMEVCRCKWKHAFPLLSFCWILHITHPSPMSSGKNHWNHFVLQSYTVCVKDYVARGRDGYEVFRNCPIIVHSQAGPVLATAVQNYFEGVVHPCRHRGCLHR